MKKSAVNPYLPLDEYVPDGEPRLFNGRVYLYGSHDRAGGDFFCLEDYVVWSASQEDLSAWRYEGVIYTRSQDPSNPDGSLELFAPDVVQGPDGRFYLYYCLKMKREFGVAVSNLPSGPFEFYGHVCYADETVFDQYMPYDPSVLVDEDRRVFLYYGFSSEHLAHKFNTQVSPGLMVVQLHSDMRTVCSTPKMCIPWEGLATGTSFEGHAYFEAPSMRKINKRYYLVYSSQWSRELCYAVSGKPDGDFIYGGVIVDNADIGVNGRTVPACMPGNNHGGILCTADQAYIFYHRHTHGTSFSRQGCAEKIRFLPDGRIPQAEITSCGLNDGPLPAEGKWPAAIACFLYGKNPSEMLNFRDINASVFPFIAEHTAKDGSREAVIRTVSDGVVAGYKYFCAASPKNILISVEGTADGTVTVYFDDAMSFPVCKVWVSLQPKDGRKEILLPVKFTGTHALYFQYRGSGSFVFAYFSFIPPTA